MNRWLIISVGVLIVLLGGWLLLNSDSGTRNPSLEGPESAQRAVEPIAGDYLSGLPKLTLRYLDGDEVNVAELQKPLDIANGRPAVINIWATWCPFCIKELPDLDVASQEFTGQVNFIAINRGESQATVEAYLADIDLPGPQTYLLDEADAFYRAIGGIAMPETLFINSDGSLNFHKRGVMSIDEIRQHVRALE